METVVKNGSKVLVLMNFSEESYRALKYATSLAKLTNRNIDIFHVTTPTAVVTSDNPACALQEVEEEEVSVRSKLRSIEKGLKNEGIRVTSGYIFGGIDIEIDLQLKSYDYDMVVIGKRKERRFSVGDVTNYLLHHYSGPVFIIEDEAEFQLDTKISIACHPIRFEFTAFNQAVEIAKSTDNPLTAISVKNESVSAKELDFPKEWKSVHMNSNGVEFEFLESSNFVGGILGYIDQSQVDLLCVGRSTKKLNSFIRLINSNTTTTEIIKKVSTPILITSNNAST